MAAWIHLQGVVTPAAEAGESEEVTGEVQKQQGNPWYVCCVETIRQVSFGWIETAFGDFKEWFLILSM